jgi:predicted DNA-binding WGR domain protein
MIKLTRCDPSQHMHRFYVLRLGLTLFGEWLLVAEWGGLGSPGRVKEEAFASQAQAQAGLSRRLSVKIRRGYMVTSA